MFVLKILSWTAGGLISLFIFLTLIPLNYVLEGRLQEGFAGRFQAGYGFLHFCICFPQNGPESGSIKICGFSLSLGKERPGNKKKREGAGSREEKKDIGSMPWLTMLNRNLIGKIMETAVLIIKAFRPRKLEVYGFLGFEDPFFTGLIAGLRSICPGIEIEPDFTGEVRDVTILIEGRIIPFQIITYGLKLLLSSEARAVLRELWSERKAERKKAAKAAKASSI